MTSSTVATRTCAVLIKSLFLNVAAAALVLPHTANAQKHDPAAVAQKVDIRDVNGFVVARLFIRGDQMRFEDAGGRVLRMDGPAKSLPPLRPATQPGGKADKLAQASIDLLQGQVDTLFAKLNEVTQRVNELGR